MARSDSPLVGEEVVFRPLIIESREESREERRERGEREKRERRARERAGG